MGFLGYSYTINEMLTASLSARWVAELAKGKDGTLHKRSVLQNCEAVNKAIEAGLAFDRRFFGASASGKFTGSGVHPLADAMVADLGSDRYYRSDKGGMDLMGPILPKHYKGLISEQFEA